MNKVPSCTVVAPRQVYESSFCTSKEAYETSHTQLHSTILKVHLLANIDAHDLYTNHSLIVIFYLSF